MSDFQHERVTFSQADLTAFNDGLKKLSEHLTAIDQAERVRKSRKPLMGRFKAAFLDKDHYTSIFWADALHIGQLKAQSALKLLSLAAASSFGKVAHLPQSERLISDPRALEICNNGIKVLRAKGCVPQVLAPRVVPQELASRSGFLLAGLSGAFEVANLIAVKCGPDFDTSVPAQYMPDYTPSEAPVPAIAAQ